MLEDLQPQEKSKGTSLMYSCVSVLSRPQHHRTVCSLHCGHRDNIRVVWRFGERLVTTTTSFFSLFRFCLFLTCYTHIKWRCVEHMRWGSCLLKLAHSRRRLSHELPSFFLQVLSPYWVFGPVESLKPILESILSLLEDSTRSVTRQNSTSTWKMRMG